MNTTIKESILDQLASCERVAQAMVRQAAALARFQERINSLADRLSETCEVNPCAGSFWFIARNREDLQVLMTLAPRWEKTSETDAIAYHATIDGVDFKLRAEDNALPGTCKLVEEEVLVPAVPEHYEKRKVVKCNEPKEDAPLTHADMEEVT